MQRLGLPFCLVLVTGCGGASPLMHSAHPLPASETSMGAGVSSQLALGNVESNIAQGEQDNQGGTTESIARRAFIGPGVAPWVGARLGLGSGNEAGLSFTGRTLRLDARHAFEFGEAALSLGLGASSVWARRSATGGGQGEGVLGFGLDAPILFGWRSRADVVSVWAGARPAFESLGNFGPVAELDSGAEEPAGTVADAYRIGLGGLVGLSVGMHPVWVTFELDVTQHWVEARERIQDTAGGPDLELDAQFRAITIAPAGALLVRF